MSKFLKQSVPGLLSVAAAAGLGYVALTPPRAPAARPAAAEVSGHVADCPVCRLPAYGHGAEASRLGAASQPVVTASSR
jgi:hypothetical protein